MDPHGSTAAGVPSSRGTSILVFTARSLDCRVIADVDPGDFASDSSTGAGFAHLPRSVSMTR
jgi:hypothetical protein